MTQDEKLASIRDWYSRISEHRRAALSIVGVVWQEYDIWTQGPYFVHRNSSWTPKPTDDPNGFVDKILDDIARRERSAARPTCDVDAP